MRLRFPQGERGENVARTSVLFLTRLMAGFFMPAINHKINTAVEC